MFKKIKIKAPMLRLPRTIFKIATIPTSFFIGYKTIKYMEDYKDKLKLHNIAFAKDYDLSHISRFDQIYFKDKKASVKKDMIPSFGDSSKQIFSFQDISALVPEEYRINSLEELVDFIDKGSGEIFDSERTFLENLEKLDRRLRSQEVQDIFKEIDEESTTNRAYSSFMQFFKIKYFEMLKNTNNLENIYKAYRPLLLEVTQNKIYLQEHINDQNKKSFCDDLDALFNDTRIKIKNAKQMNILFSNKLLLSHIYHFDFSNVDKDFKLEDCPEIDHKCTFVFKQGSSTEVNMDLFSGIEKFTGLKELILGFVSDGKSPRVNFENLPKSVESLVAIGYRLIDSDLYALSKSQVKEIVMTDHGTIFDFSFFMKIKSLRSLYMYNNTKKTNEEYFDQRFKNVTFVYPIRIFIKKDLLLPPTIFSLGITENE